MNRDVDPGDIDGLMNGILQKMESGPVRDVEARAQVLDAMNERLNAELGVVTTRRAGRSYQRWDSVGRRVVLKSEYTLGELVGASDASLIDVAYRAIFRRAPDTGGFTYFLNQLRTGDMSKVELLAALRWSEEGRAKSVHVDGLLVPYVLQKLKRRRFVGPIIGWLHAFLRLGRIAERQAAIERTQSHELHELGDRLNAAIHEAQLMDQEFGNLKRDAQRLGEDVAQVKSELAQITARLDALDLDVLPYLQPAVQRQRELEASEPAMAALYSAFEDRFRGSRELIRSRIEPYLEWVRQVGAGSDEAPVLDIGCGRGEWLELLRDNGLQASGIDLNHDFVESCRTTGLRVVEGDAVDVLRSMPDASVGAITSMHLVEHVPFDRLVALVSECRRVLRPGGLVFLETPNPENLAVASHYFYMDPTHRNPLPPAMLSWLVENRGFVDVRIERLHAHRELNAPPLLSSELPGATSINALLWKLHEAPDYAVLGIKQ